MKPTVLIITCEHAVNTVPDNYMFLFQKHHNLLKSSRAMDIGSLDITRHVCHDLGCQFTQTQVTRLLIDCNRSVSHNRCFSKFSHKLPDSEKKYLIEQYYIPFRQQTMDLITHHHHNNEQILHVSIHTFKPFLRGLRQNAGIGLLYDSRRHAEKEVARIWHGLLLQETPTYLTRMNYPFPGKSDSFTHALRHQYGEQDYLGIEMEINQVLANSPASISEVANAIAHSLKQLLELL